MEDTIAKLRARVDAATEAYKDLDRQRQEAGQWAKVEAEAPFREPLAAALRDLDGARTALTEALSTLSAHPWEGKTVRKAKERYHSYRRTETATVRGVVEVRRLGTEFPGNLSNWRRPDMGKPFVRLLKASGEPGLQIDRLDDEWKLEQTDEA